MPALQMRVNRHLNAYHRSAPLLLQFILTEFLQAYQQFQAVRTLLDEEQFNHSLFSLLNRFSGPSPERLKSFYWGSDNGSLHRLHHYAAFMSDQTKTLGSEFPPLEETCRKCWLLGTHLFGAIEGRRLNITLSILHKLQRYMRQIAQELVKAIALLRDDENLLYFLLRNSVPLDAIYGSNFVLRLLDSLFSNGLVDAKNFLIEKYTARGFDKLAEKIRQQFDRIV